MGHWHFSNTVQVTVTSLETCLWYGVAWKYLETSTFANIVTCCTLRVTPKILWFVQTMIEAFVLKSQCLVWQKRGLSCPVAPLTIKHNGASSGSEGIYEYIYIRFHFFIFLIRSQRNNCFFQTAPYLYFCDWQLAGIYSHTMWYLLGHASCSPFAAVLPNATASGWDIGTKSTCSTWTARWLR